MRDAKNSGTRVGRELESQRTGSLGGGSEMDLGLDGWKDDPGDLIQRCEARRKDKKRYVVARRISVYKWELVIGKRAAVGVDVEASPGDDEQSGK